MALRILHYSDVENATDDPRRIGRLTTCLRERRDDATLVCGTGDTTGPGLLAMETDGGHSHAFFEAVSPDFSTVGNHDFDHGADALRSVIDDSPQTWLVANCYDGADQFGAERGGRSTAVAAVEADGEITEVGLVGVTDPLTLEDHSHAEALTVTDPVAAVEEAIADGLAGSDYVVVLSHAGGRDDDIARVDGVDIVLGGHDHDQRADTVDGTPVVHPGERGELVAEVRFGGDTSAVQLDGDSPTVELLDVTEFPVAEDVASRYRALFTELGLDESLTRVDEPVSRRRVDRYPESAIGNFVADAFRWAAGADVAICHPLMLRGGPPLEGEVTTGEVRAITPFDNHIHSTTLDGDDLVALLEWIGDPPFSSMDREVFGHVSGAHLTWRRTDVSLDLDDVTVGDEESAPSDTYSVAAPSFEFFSDIYPMLESESIEADHGHQHDALVEYAREWGIDTGTDGRMTTVVDTADGEFRSLR